MSDSITGILICTVLVVWFGFGYVLGRLHVDEKPNQKATIEQRVESIEQRLDKLEQSK